MRRQEEKSCVDNNLMRKCVMKEVRSDLCNYVNQKKKEKKDTRRLMEVEAEKRSGDLVNGFEELINLSL